MAEKPRGPFREKSLERLSSPERLDQLLQVVDQRSWLPLAALGGLLAVLVAWSVFGTIPVNIEGRGILVRPRGIVELESPGSGYVEAIHAGVGDRVEPGQELGRIKRPDLELQVELKRFKLGELTRLRAASGFLADPESENSGLSVPGKRAPESHIEGSRQVAERLRLRGLELIDAERDDLRAQIRLARELRADNEVRLAGRSQLADDGVIAREDVLEVKSELQRVKTLLINLEMRLRDLDKRRLEIQDQYFNHVQRLTDFQMDLESYDQRISDLNNEVRVLEGRLRDESSIVSQHRARVLELNVEVGQFLSPGDRLGSLDIGDPDEPLHALVYFTVRDGKRLSTDEPAQIRVTPDSVERQRYGSINGTIRSVSDFPVTLAQAAAMIGNRELAETLIAGGYRMQVLASLERDPATLSGFNWTSRKGPDMQFTAGTTTTARVAVENPPPITFVLPILRQFFGLQ